MFKTRSMTETRSVWTSKCICHVAPRRYTIGLHLRVQPIRELRNHRIVFARNRRGDRVDHEGHCHCIEVAHMIRKDQFAANGTTPFQKFAALAAQSCPQVNLFKALLKFATEPKHAGGGSVLPLALFPDRQRAEFRAVAPLKSKRASAPVSRPTRHHHRRLGQGSSRRPSPTMSLSPPDASLGCTDRTARR